MAGSTTMIKLKQHELEATVFGSGTPAVVIEPAFGGTAADWRPIAERVAAETTVIAYNRAAYGASSPARDSRSAADIAADLDGVLRSLGVTGPLVLVGHSMGGVYIRAFAARQLERVAGMVLVDSSHEGQWAILPAYYTLKIRLLSALMVPQLIVRGSRWRGGADRRSILREYRRFKRLTTADRPLADGGLGDRPLTVLTRGPEGPKDQARLWEAWHDLHRELARLSRNSRHVVSDSPMHYLHEGDPDLVTSAITDVVRCARGSTPPAEPVAASESE